MKNGWNENWNNRQCATKNKETLSLFYGSVICSSLDSREHTILSSCGPGFKSQAQQRCFFNLVSDCVLNLSSYREKDENKQKRDRGWAIFKKVNPCLSNIKGSSDNGVSWSFACPKYSHKPHELTLHSLLTRNHEHKKRYFSSTCKQQNLNIVYQSSPCPWVSGVAVSRIGNCCKNLCKMVSYLIQQNIKKGRPGQWAVYLFITPSIYSY